MMIIDSPFYKYHHQTKHTVDKLSSNRHFLDWANQPNPFRFYDGAPEIVLPHEMLISPANFFESMNSLTENNVEPHEADSTFISNLLFYSMAISAWKEITGTGHRWALRVNPSSGNLHPTDTHLLLNGIEGLPDGSYHYYVPRHSLEHRAEANLGSQLWRAVSGQDISPKLVICLTSIFWRESWKYQSRAFRYCNHDLGHALASIMLSASVLGWKVHAIGEFPDVEVTQLLGLNGNDEKPFLIIGAFPAGEQPANSTSFDFPSVNDIEFKGVPNVLSAAEVEYPAIDAVYESTVIDKNTWRKRFAQNLPEVTTAAVFEGLREKEITTGVIVKKEFDESVHQIIRKRRSAVDLDGQRTMPESEFMLILKTLSNGFSADFQTQGKSGFHLIDLYLYVHRVEGLTPGVYYWARQTEKLQPLALGDQKQVAKFVSCFQDIAADGCFAVSMVANFNLGYELFGNRCYRYVHCEAGLIGQWLYLASTALNYQATGIGCFLDDEINTYLPLPEGQEVVYNFTVGQAVYDPRLTTLAAYDFLN